MGFYFFSKVCSKYKSVAIYILYIYTISISIFDKTAQKGEISPTTSSACLKTPWVFVWDKPWWKLVRSCQSHLQVGNVVPLGHPKEVLQYISSLHFWLVVYLPLWKIWVRQLGLLFPTYGTIKFMFQRFPKHQPDLDAFSLQDHRLWLGILWGGLRAQSPMATSTPPWCSNRGKCISSQGAEQRRAMCHGDFHAKTFCCSILPNTENPPIFSR